jgi:hypothetical protein
VNGGVRLKYDFQHLTLIDPISGTQAGFHCWLVLANVRVDHGAEERFGQSWLATTGTTGSKVWFSLAWLSLLAAVLDALRQSLGPVQKCFLVGIAVVAFVASYLLTVLLGVTFLDWSD